MGTKRPQASRARVLELACAQHGVLSRAQLLDLGLSPQAIKHRIVTGRLYPVFRGVYAVGRPQLTRYGRWMAAVLRCGRGAVLSHQSAAALWDMTAATPSRTELSVPATTTRRVPRLIVYRRSLSCDEVTTHDGIPVTTPACTLIDIARHVSAAALETAINEADKRNLIDPEELRAVLGPRPGRPGVRVLRKVLDAHTFVLTDSELERRFLRISCAAALPLPQTGRHLNGFKVDFYWPDLGLVVETDGLRYHRTPAQQARDRARDQAHAAAGLTPLRFTHSQIRFQPSKVRSILVAVVRQIRSREPGCRTL